MELMKPHILTYSQINESTEFNSLSFEEAERLVELGLLNDDLLKIYNYIKNGSVGSLRLAHSKLTHLPNWLTKVDGSLDITGSDIEDIPDSLKITYNIYASYSKLKIFRRPEVFGDLCLDYSKISKLPDGLHVTGFLSVEGIQFEEIPKKLKVNGIFYINNSNLCEFTDKELIDEYKIGAYIHR